MKKILYISYDGMTDSLGQSQVLPYLVGLSKKGMQFHLISFEKSERFQKHKHIIEKICEESSIVWHPLSYTKKPPVLSTAIDVFRMKRLARNLHKIHSFDLIHCRSYISALAGLSMGEKYKIPWVFDMRGFWADERVDGELWNLKNPLFRAVYSYFKRKEKKFLTHASAVVSLTEIAKIEIIKNWDIKYCAPIFVIPCCVDTEHFTIRSFHEKTEFQQDAIRIVYLGSLGTWYMIEEMLSFFKVVLERFPKAFFTIVTPDSPKIISDIYTKLNISSSNIAVKSAQRNEVPAILSENDLAVYFIKPSYSKMSSSPTKMGEILAMGLPIITNSGIGDVSVLNGLKPFGAVISGFNSKNYSAALDEFLKIRGESKSYFREIALTHFDLKNGVERYLEIYQSI